MKTTLTAMLKLFGAALSTVAVGALGLAGCGSHYTTQEAYDTCHEIISATAEVDEPEAFAECVACHENCGTDCNALGTAPETFSCPDDQGAGGGGTGGGEG